MAIQYEIVNGPGMFEFMLQIQMDSAGEETNPLSFKLIQRSSGEKFEDVFRVMALRHFAYRAVIIGRFSNRGIVRDGADGRWTHFFRAEYDFDCRNGVLYPLSDNEREELSRLFGFDSDECY